MTSILRDWLEKVNIEWQKEQRLEEVFLNGYLIGKLLCNLQIGGLNQDLFEDKFVNDTSIKGITQNYNWITQYLCDGGIDVKPKLLHDIADNVSGAIHRFIYDLKCFVDRMERETMSQTVDRSTAKKGLNEGTASFKSPPRISSPTRNRKYMYEETQKRDVELQIRKIATQQFHERAELKWQKYRDHQTQIEEMTKMEKEFEKQLKNERMEQHHDLLIKTLKDNHQKREHNDKESKGKWRMNQKIKRKRISEKQHFEETQHLKHLNKRNITRRQTANNVEQCLDEFENILNKTEKVQNNENQENQASEIQQNNIKTESNINDDQETERKQEDPLQHLEKLRHKLPEKTVSMKETQSYLEQIKINVAKQRGEAMKREQRRKKLIADEMERNKENERNDRNKEINDIINKQCQVRKEFDDKIKTINLHKQIFKRNAKLMKQKENERKQKDENIKLKRDRDHFEIKKVEFKTKLTIQTQKLKELKLKQQQHQHVGNIKYCKQLVSSIVDITYKSVLYRQLSDQEQVPHELWSEWMHLLSSTKKSEHILTNIDENNKKKEISKDLNVILENEKQCHSDIIHIKNGLMECMDIHGSINRLLINETELNNYLNGKGIWTYDDTEQEPSNDTLGAIIKEIVAVSEGPDPRYQKIIPDVPISIAFIGKPFVGKSTQSQQIADKYALQIIDAEKCIKDAIDSFEKHDANTESEGLSTTQQIGQRLKNVLEDGKAVDDELYMDMIFDAILSVNEDKKTNGWILDGFPIKRSQCELLEAKLSGYIDSPSPKTGKISKNKHSKIAPPNMDEDTSQNTTIESGLDFVFYLDIDHETENAHEILFNRAKGRLVDTDSGRIYHITENPPPHDEVIKERLSSPPDDEYVATLPEHFKAFDERKDELKHWFQRFGSWIELDCGQDRNKLTLSLVEMIKQRIEIKKQKEEEQKMKETETELDTENSQETKDENDDTENIEEAKDENIDNENTEKEPIQEEEETDVVEMPWDQAYALQDQDMCRRLHYLWCNVEESYTDGITRTFELLRHERRRILAYLASTREYFYNFLRRVDDKQELIDEYQSEYNFIHRDMRRDDDTKDELHERTQELSFKLFECSMKRKNECIEELNTIKRSVWIHTENDTLLNIIVGIIQYELNRYISTIAVINDYFALKNNQSISEKSMDAIDLLSVIRDNVTSTKANKGNNEDMAEIKRVSDQLQNAINLGSQQIIVNEDETERFNELRLNVINEENERYKMRLMRLKKILSLYVHDVEDRHIDLLQKLDKWIALRIDSENDAINLLINHIQKSIENESELNYRMILEGENFLIDRDIIVYPMPNPIQKRCSNHAFSTKGVFTAKQIKEFMELLRSQNVHGIIEYNSMCEILKRLSKNAYGQNEPTLWSNLNDEHLYILLSSVFVPHQSNKYINWKLFIVSLMLQTLSVINNTVAVPSLDTLFNLKQALNAKDNTDSGKLNHHQFGQISLWFDKTRNNVWQNILFDLFGFNENIEQMDEQKQDNTEKFINYNQLLYHLCFNDQIHFGFEKILSLSENMNIVRNAQLMTKKHLKLIQMRGIEDVQIEDVSEMTYNKELTINEMKQNKEMLASFNCANIEQILSQ